jgi:hypothetical protein
MPKTCLAERHQPAGRISRRRNPPSAAAHHLRSPKLSFVSISPPQSARSRSRACTAPMPASFRRGANAPVISGRAGSAPSPWTRRITRRRGVTCRSIRCGCGWLNARARRRICAAGTTVSRRWRRSGIALIAFSPASSCERSPSVGVSRDQIPNRLFGNLSSSKWRFGNFVLNFAASHNDRI